MEGGSDTEHFQWEETFQPKLRLQPLQESMFIMFDWDKGSVLLFLGTNKKKKKERFLNQRYLHDACFSFCTFFFLYHNDLFLDIFISHMKINQSFSFSYKSPFCVIENWFPSCFMFGLEM